MTMCTSNLYFTVFDKLLLEPYTNSRDIAYVVVAPDSDCVLNPVKKYFKELSTIYELCRLGRHCPITKVLRDGIMRVGKGTAKKLADEPVDEWFNHIGDGPIASRLKLYAQACRYHLAPHLATQPFDSSLIDSPVLKPPDKPLSVASPRTTAGTETQEKDQTSFKSEVDIKTEPSASSSNEQPTVSTSGNPDAGDVEDNQQTPTVVIYLVEPFTHGSADADVYRLASLGLLRSYTHMLQFLPDHIKNNIHLQVITLDSILSLGQLENSERRKDQLKALAFSVFSQCHQVSMHQTIAKSLTGFGPAAAQDMFLKSRDVRNAMTSPPPSKVFTLAPQKDKQTELGEMFGDRREKSSILFCTYCLTEDQRFLTATCTDDKGDIMQSCCISIEVPNRTRRKKASIRKPSLHKLLDFIVEVLSKRLHAWRLVINRLGRLGHGELRDWATLLSRKSLLRYSRQLRDMCHQCSVLGSPDTPAILSACLVSLEPDSSLRIMADQFTPDDRFSSSCNSCCLSTPEDASCTHILVFPTSATTQSSQATFQQEHIDPLSTTLADDDIFQALNDDDIAVGSDINDIFRWTESPPQSPGASPRRDSISQPGSPSCGMNGRHSPFHHGGPNRGSGHLPMDTIEEPLQLLQQPLALGYYVSTAKTGPLPKWFWSTCPQLQNVCPVFLKSALLIHSPFVQQSSDDLLHANPHTRNYHPLDSNLTTDVLRYVLEGFNSLSWLSLDPSTHDRRSCLPVHIQVLMQLYQSVEALI
ncbi:UNVERIFIED_CONTAM: skd [Trichonephila clavipes]